MKLVIKVWCLPKMAEDQLRQLHVKIVAAVVGITVLRLKDENDMVCLFPPDMMSYGLGEEIIIEVTHCLLGGKRARQDLSIALRDAVKTMFPETRVIECIVSELSHEQGFATTR
jgi:hypothetical protein